MAPTARSTPFLCSCAKKRGGAPKKRAFGCRHGGCWVPPASPTDSKPQHYSRLRQADLSARSTHRVQVNLTHQFVPLGLTPNGRGGRAHQADVEASKRFSLAARHRFFGQAPKKWGRKAGQANAPHPTYRRTRTKRKSPPACNIKKAAPGGDRFCFISRPAGRVSFCARWRGGRGSAWGRSPGGRPACRRRAGPWRSSRTCRNSPSGRRGSIRGRRWRCRTSRR